MAAGYELVKGEQKSCLLVWDINYQSQREKNNPQHQSQNFDLIDTQQRSQDG